MTATTTITMIPSTSFGSATGNYDGTSTSFESDNTKGDGYYGFSDGVHTAQVRVTGFPGTIKFQGSLATTPTSTDWVDIAGAALAGDGSSLITNSYIYNFTGNYVWIRASITNFTAGSINTILLAH
jgi:hypothetical protein